MQTGISFCYYFHDFCDMIVKWAGNNNNTFGQFPQSLKPIIGFSECILHSTNYQCLHSPMAFFGIKTKNVSIEHVHHSRKLPKTLLTFDKFMHPSYSKYWPLLLAVAVVKWFIYFPSFWVKIWTNTSSLFYLLKWLEQLYFTCLWYLGCITLTFDHVFT